MSRLCFSISDNLKKRFESMSERTNLQQSQLMLIALHALIAYYDNKGSFIFADLISPELRRKSGKYEVDNSSSRLCFRAPDDLKKQLESMGKELGLQQSQLMIMAMQSLVTNNETTDYLIFADLLNPMHREKRKTR